MEDYVAMLKSDLQKGTSTLAIIKHGSLNGWFPPTWPENTPPQKKLASKGVSTPGLQAFSDSWQQIKVSPIA